MLGHFLKTQTYMRKLDPLKKTTATAKTKLSNQKLNMIENLQNMLYQGEHRLSEVANFTHEILIMKNALKLWNFLQSNWKTKKFIIFYHIKYKTFQSHWGHQRNSKISLGKSIVSEFLSKVSKRKKISKQ